MANIVVDTIISSDTGDVITVPDSPSTLWVQTTGRVIATGELSYAIWAAGITLSLTVDGGVASTNSSAVFAGLNSPVEVRDDGYISSTGGIALNFGGSLINSGFVGNNSTLETISLRFKDTSDHVIINNDTGIIKNSGTGNAISSASNVNIYNYGYIDGDIEVVNGRALIFNHEAIFGNVVLDQNNDFYYGDGRNSLTDRKHGLVTGYVFLGPGNDVAVGGTNTDRFIGFFGNDTLVGGGGNDVINGGDGFDYLTGGAGRDVLAGGAHQDIFFFNSWAESGKTAATRDIIKDFVHLQDDINFSNIDANGSAAGNTAFRFLAVNGAAFTGVKGQLHWLQINAAGTANDKTIIEGDINGDKIADFQIELTGLKTLTAADFIL